MLERNQSKKSSMRRTSTFDPSTITNKESFAKEGF